MVSVATGPPAASSATRTSVAGALVALPVLTVNVNRYVPASVGVTVGVTAAWSDSKPVAGLSSLRVRP